MKKFWLMFAFVLCGALAFTSCDKDENEIKPGGDNNQEQPEGNWKVGIDESQAPGKLILRVNIEGVKTTYTASFSGGKCTKCVVAVEYAGEKYEENYPGLVGMTYEQVKYVFQQVYNAYK